MKLKRVIFLALLVLAAFAAISIIFSNPSQKTEITITYIETISTNGTLPAARLKVTNSGSSPAHIRFANVARKDGNEWRYDLQSMVMFSSCTVGAATNCVASVPFPFNSRPGTWRVEAVVFKKRSFFEKVVFAAGRLWARAIGKGNYTRFWFPDQYAWAYEVNSGDIPGIALNWPARELGPVKRDTKEDLSGLDFDWISGRASSKDARGANLNYAP